MSEIIKLRKRVGMVHVTQVEMADPPFPDLTPGPGRDTEDARETPAAHVDEEMVSAVLMKRNSAETDALIQRSLEQEYKRGFDDGCKATDRRMREEIESRVSEERKKLTLKVIVQLESLMANIRKEFSNLQQKSEEIVLRFSLAVAEQILKREVLLDNTVVLQQIKEGLRRVLGVDHIKVRVNPIDEAMVREHRAAVASGSDSLQDMIIEGDEKVERGGCILESDSGNVDVRISTQMKKIETAMIEGVQ
ncbi:MAG TPA: FliH/SctL family protein [Bacteroidota bacterium]|nr:FliH/SctL family protein [Bacteroidota bacterium]